MLRYDLQTARRAAKRHAAAAARAGFIAHEQALTEIVLTRVGPSARVYTFSQRAEARTGADWLWWWRGSSEWFGVLIQAKKNKPRPLSDPWYDFGYRTGSGLRQVDLLVNAARWLGVPAAYLLYNHPPISRSTPVSTACCSLGRESWRTRLQVAVVPALVAQGLVGGMEDVAAQHARPLECLPCGGLIPRFIPPVSAGITDAALRRFLAGDDADLPRVVALGMLAQLADRRIGQFWAAEPTEAPPTFQSADRAFDSLPTDRGHYSEPYFEHILRGLRSKPPGYVAALEDGVPFDELADEVGGVGGVVVLQNRDDGGV